ncbi:MAG: ester cyclase [Steroidobacteraceae bacterium]|jgi:predicted ester cyclase|nr:ester cyclase [Steroidobacteraceae bacterium]
MPMHGFDAEFTDLPDYIVKITARIWEGRGIGAIRRYYADDCPMYTSMGPGAGVPAIVAGTIDTLNAFPDRRLLPEDIVWSGDDRAGYLSSHRIIAPATHLGPGPFGPPTGRAVSFRTIADCFCVGNRIVEEWLARDQAGIALQLGLDPQELAAQLAARDGAAGKAPWHLEPARRLRAEGRFREPVLQAHPAAVQVREGLDAVWNRAELDRVAELYHPACTVHVPGDRTLHGPERVNRWLFGYLAAFPDARVYVEHSIALEEPGQPVRVATRWWLTGTHTGHGAFGPPSGATVLLLGITHSNLVNGRIRDEWVVADELALRKQIALQRG